MSEFIYKIGQRTGRRPIIRKLGAIRRGVEQTPVLFQGIPVIVESTGPNGSCIQVRNLKTGEISDVFGKGYYFASAFVEGDTLYAFASSARDERPMSMYQGEDASAWHDPRGGHTIRMFFSKDMKTWKTKDIITCLDRRFWNTSVCKGDGKYVMALEVSADEGYQIPEIGQAFTTFFAESTDLVNWRMMPDKYSYTSDRYNACPTLRYLNGWYYMICLETLPCKRYASYIYRTQNFEDWEVGFHNPIMMFDDEDRIPHKDSEFTAEDMDLLEHGLNINNSDIDLFEVEGKTHIYYANGDQMTHAFLCEAVYDGPLVEFLENFFR